MSRTYQYTSPSGVVSDPVELPDQVAPATWAELHLRYLHHDGTDDSGWLLNDFTPRVPWQGCDCIPHWLALLHGHPARWDDAFAWSVEVHNLTSQRIEREQGLKRPSMTVAQALQRWSNSA